MMSKEWYEGEIQKLDRRLRAAKTNLGEIERLRAENEKLKECIAEWQKDSALNGRW